MRNLRQQVEREANQWCDDEFESRSHLILRRCVELNLPPNLSLPDHIRGAIGVETEHWWNRPDHIAPEAHVGWDFTRWVRIHPALRESSVADAEFALDRAYPRWADEVAEIGECLDGEEVRLAFQAQWDKIRILPDENPLVAALHRSEVNPLSVPEATTALQTRFVSLAGWLQVVRGNASICLPTHKLGSLLDVSPRSVTRLRRFAELHGYIKTVRSHYFRPDEPGSARATEFRFDVRRFPALVEAASNDCAAGFDK